MERPERCVRVVFARGHRSGKTGFRSAEPEPHFVYMRDTEGGYR
jgi:hypothetical protein